MQFSIRIQGFDKERRACSCKKKMRICIYSDCRVPKIVRRFERRDAGREIERSLDCPSETRDNSGGSPRYQWRLRTLTKRHSYTSPSNAAGREPIKSLEFTVNRT